MVQNGQFAVGALAAVGVGVTYGTLSAASTGVFDQNNEENKAKNKAGQKFLHF